MARRRTQAAKQAQALLVWLETLDLPTRVINALRRDLEVITGEREGEEGSGVLTGLDQARFVEELYRSRGGQVGKVPTIAKGAIDALRAAIPAPVSGDRTEAAQPAQDNATPEGAASTQPTQDDEEPADAAQKRAGAQDDEVSASPSDDARENVEAAQEAVPEVTAPETADVALVSPDAQEELPAGDVREANAEPLADVAPEAGTALTESSASPKRRGRPPRAEAAAAEGTVAAEASATSGARHDRRPRGKGASATPGTADGAAQLVPSSEGPAPYLATPTAPPIADASFDVLLRLWRELHPQGRRAAMHYMAALLVEV